MVLSNKGDSASGVESRPENPVPPVVRMASTPASAIFAEGTGKMGSSTLSIGFFFAFMALTLAITYWAARRTRTTEHFFAAGGQVTAWQNGWALAGDFLSAAALLGIAGIVTSNGFDGMIYSIGWLVGWPIILFLIVEPLRNVGRFTFADVVAYRLRQRPVRLAGAVGTLAVILFYLIAQMVATGSLIKLLFSLPYTWSVVVVGSVMLVYVLFGGMLATTWVQVVKAALLMGGGILLAFLVLTHFDMNPLKLFAAASEKFGANFHRCTAAELLSLTPKARAPRRPAPSFRVTTRARFSMR